VTALEKQERRTDETKQSESIDTTRRKLLGGIGKAAWIAPTLTLLSFSKANAQIGPPPPPPACDTAEPPPFCPS